MKLKNLFKGIVTTSLALCMAVGVAACTPDDPIDPPPPGPGPGEDPNPPIVDPNPPVSNVEISIDASVTEVKTNDSVSLTVTVTGAEDTSYTWEYVDSEVIINENTMVVTLESNIDKYITVTAVANADTTVKASKTFTYRAATVNGQVGDLTSEMIQEIGNPSIKVSGNLTDVYEDFKNSSNNSSRMYDFSVTMEEGKWSGSWNLSQNKKNVMTDIYRKGTAEATNSNGVFGHVLEQMYIDKDNEVASKAVKDFQSIPAVWEAQHMWNHLGNLNVNTFTYDIANDIYYHDVDLKSEEDLYLMTYLSYSLTPMLSDTLNTISFKVEDGKITKLIAQTEAIYYNVTEENKTGDSMSYTKLELTFADIGTAKVADPVPFEAPEYVEKLEAALASMGNADNYTYKAVDTTTYSPDIDGGDYEVDGTTYSAPATTYKVNNNTSMVGEVGSVGKITKDATLVAKTTKYSSSLDGKDYRTEYTGTRQFNGYYEEYAATGDGSGKLYGTKRVTGNISDKMPAFDFSANIFELDTIRKNEYGIKTYSFVLRETAVTRDVALQVSSYGYAESATASTSNQFTIVVDEDGRLISTTYPYSLNFGTYTGYVNTTYSNIGTTTLDEDLFDNYEARKVITKWSDALINYRPMHSTAVPDNLVSGDIVINAFFGEFASYVPDPELFVELFGDNLSNPRHWADWRENGNNADGKPTYIDYISFNAQYMDYDENRQLNDWNKLANNIDKAMEDEGFKFSNANSDKDGTSSASKKRYLTYIKTNADGDGIMVVFENMGTSFIYVYIYKTGDWQLDRRA